MADDAGALLVRSGLVSSAALDGARAKVADRGGTLGEQLVGEGIVDDDELTNFYKQRLLVPQVNPNMLARLPAKVVAVIPSEMAIELRAIPVSLDDDNNLTVAMSDPSDRHGVDEIAFYTGSYVVRAVATQMQIAWCLAHYYGHVTELGERLLQEGGEQPEPRADSQPAPRPRTRGVTGDVSAMRHKALVPGDVFADDHDDGDQEPRPTQQQATVGNEDSATPVDTPRPRSKTASGEIRVQKPRAPSIRPELPEDSGRIFVIEPDDEEETAEDAPSGPNGRGVAAVIEIEAEEGGAYEPVMIVGEANESKPVPKRRRPADPDPPELAARAGEVQLATGQPIRKIEFDEPRIIIADELAEEIAPASRAPRAAPIEVSGEMRVRDHREVDPIQEELSSIFVELGNEDSAPAMIYDARVNESSPVILDRRRPSDAPTTVSINAAPSAEIADPPSEPLELPVKARDRRDKRVTQVGIGAVSAATREKLVDSIPAVIEDSPTDVQAVIDIDPTRVDAHAVPPADDDQTDESLAAPPTPYDLRDSSLFEVPQPQRTTPPPSGQVRLDGVQRAVASDDDEDGPEGKPTTVMTALELDAVIPERKSEILPGHLERRAQAPAADTNDDEWGPPGTTIPPPLLGTIPGAITPASGIIPIPNVDSAPLIIAPPVPPERGLRAQTEGGLSRALEEATARVLELIHTLDHTIERDQIIAVMIAHLAESHRRAGFFSMRSGALSLFAITPRMPEMSVTQLVLDRPSTLQDVVGTRLPYRGPMLDDTSRGFLTATLGSCPPEILLVPIAVRERVVGVLFGDQRVKHTFDDQLALAARAAGMALERLLKMKRG